MMVCLTERAHKRLEWRLSDPWKIDGNSKDLKSILLFTRALRRDTLLIKKTSPNAKYGVDAMSFYFTVVI